MVIRNDEELARAKEKAASLSELADQIKDLLAEGGLEDLGGDFSAQMRRQAERLEDQIKAYEELRELFARQLDLEGLVRLVENWRATNPGLGFPGWPFEKAQTLLSVFGQAGLDIRFVVTARSLEAATAAAE